MEQPSGARSRTEAVSQSSGVLLSLRRPEVQALILYLISVSLHLYRLGSIPPPWDHFEKWVLQRRGLWHLAPSEFIRAATVFAPNDTT